MTYMLSELKMDNIGIDGYGSEDEDLNDQMLQNAIAASIEAANKENLAVYHANRVLDSKSNLGYSNIISQQDKEYEDALNVDRIKAEMALYESVKAIDKLIQPTQSTQFTSQYNIEDADANDIYRLRFRLPDGSIKNHSFHKHDSLSSMIRQIKYDMNYNGNIKLIIPPNIPISCDPTTSISNCGIGDRITISVIVT